VQGEAASKAAVGIQRPRAILKLNVAAERNDPVFVQAVEQNPYNIALYKGGVPSKMGEAFVNTVPYGSGAQIPLQTPFPN
jgi:hypothetical protein